MLSKSFEEIVVSSSGFLSVDESLVDSEVTETLEDFNFKFFLRPSVTKIGSFYERIFQAYYEASSSSLIVSYP